MESSSPERRDDVATYVKLADTASGTPRSELRKAIVRVQHQMNNPLAALLAEAQLLGMEPSLGAEHRAAATRITELARRVIALVRELDAVAKDPEPEVEPADESARQS